MHMDDGNLNRQVAISDDSTITNSDPEEAEMGAVAEKSPAAAAPAPAPAPATGLAAAAAASDLPPEEGLRGWLCVVGSGTCIFCTFGFLSAIGVFQTTYEQSILSTYSASAISWIFAIQLALMWAPGPFWGRVVDTYGPAPVLYPCAALCVFALCMTSLADQYYQVFLAQGLAFGIGCGGVFTAAMVCVGQWFVRRRGLAVGLATTGSSLGGVIFPIFFDRVSKDVGFYGAIRYTALLIGILLAASTFLVRARLPRKKWNPKLQWFDLSLFGNPEFALYAFGAYFVMWGLWAPYDFISSSGEVSGLTPTLSLYLISILNSSSIPGRIIPPHLADRIGHFNVTTICGFITGASILALWLPFNYHHSEAGLIVFALVYGFASGAFVSLLLPCVAKMGSLDTLGVRFGTFQLLISVSCLTGLPIMGAILADQGNTDFSGLQLFGGACGVAGGVLITAATWLFSRSKGTWKV